MVWSWTFICYKAKVCYQGCPFNILPWEDWSYSIKSRLHIERCYQKGLFCSHKIWSVMSFFMVLLFVLWLMLPINLHTCVTPNTGSLNIFISTFGCLSVCMFVCMCMCACVCMHAHIYFMLACIWCWDYIEIIEYDLNSWDMFSFLFLTTSYR